MIFCGILGRTLEVVGMETVAGSAEVGCVTFEVSRSVRRVFGCRRLAKSRCRRRNMEIKDLKRCQFRMRGFQQHDHRKGD